MKRMIALIALVFCLGACSSVKSEKWDSLRTGMSVSDVEKKVGKPKEVITDTNEISSTVYDDYKKISEMVAMVPSKELDRELEQLSAVYEASESGKNVSMYVYQVDSGDGKVEREVYFVGGAVTYIFGQSKE